MRNRTGISVLVLALALAACGGGAPTQAPGGGGGQATPGAGPTDAAQATQAGGGGGNKPAGWDQYGKVHIEISGPISKSGDYGFIPAGSIFGGTQGSSLSFAIEGTNEIVSILTTAEGKTVVSYGGEDFTAPAAECTTSNWNIGATSASGSFDCKAGFVITAAGATLQNATIKGSFDAHT